MAQRSDHCRGSYRRRRTQEHRAWLVLQAQRYARRHYPDVAGRVWALCSMRRARLLETGRLTFRCLTLARSHRSTKRAGPVALGWCCRLTPTSSPRYELRIGIGLCRLIAERSDRAVEQGLVRLGAQLGQTHPAQISEIVFPFTLLNQRSSVHAPSLWHGPLLYFGQREDGLLLGIVLRSDEASDCKPRNSLPKISLLPAR